MKNKLLLLLLLTLSIGLNAQTDMFPGALSTILRENVYNSIITFAISTKRGQKTEPQQAAP